MTPALAVVICVALVSLVAALHVCLPFIVKRSDADTKLHALEAANHALSERVADVEAHMRDGTPLRKLRAMSR